LGRRRLAGLLPFAPRFVLALTVVSAVALGCDQFRKPLTIPADQRQVELAGIVQSVAADGSQVTLTDGSTVALDPHEQVFAVGSLGLGALFLGGVNEPWYGYTSMRTGPDCYRLSTRGRDDGATVATELGVQFVKAPGFVGNGDGKGILADPSSSFCLDRDGRVTSYGKAG
jgi:hypothetical protein